MLNITDVIIVFMKLRCLGEKKLNSKIGNEKTEQKKVMISELILVFEEALQL